MRSSFAFGLLALALAASACGDASPENPPLVDNSSSSSAGSTTSSAASTSASTSTTGTTTSTSASSSSGMMAENPAPDFTVLDLNPDSPYAGESYGVEKFQGQISAWFFGHST